MNQQMQRNPRGFVEMGGVLTDQGLQAQGDATDANLSHVQLQAQGDATDAHLSQAARKKGKPVKSHKQRRFEKSVHALAASSCGLIPRAVFSRVARDIVSEHSNTVQRFSAKALSTFQAASEEFVTQRMQLADQLAHHAGRQTVSPKDLRVAHETLSLQ